MNSLQDLNNWSRVGGIAFQDDRPPTLVFSDGVAEDIYADAYEGQYYHPVCPIAITAMYSQPTWPTLTINNASLPGSTVSWDSISPAMYISTSGDETTIHEIRSSSDFTLIQSPNITLPLEALGVNSFTSNLSYNDGGNSKIWTTYVTIKTLKQLTTPTVGTYTLNSTNLVPNTPTVSNLGDPSLENDDYVINITSNTLSQFGNLSSMGFGNSIWSGTGLRVGGNLLAINSHLGNLSYTPATDFSSEAYLTYSLINLTKRNYVTNQFQALREVASLYMSNPGAATYDLNTAGIITSAPQVTDYDGNPSGNYVCLITPTVKSTVYSLTPGGSGGGYTWDSGSSAKLLTLWGTKAQLNSHLSTITMQPGINTIDTISMNYQLTTSSNISVNKTQTLTIDDQDTALSNTSYTRYFIGGVGGQVVFDSFFNPVPQIIETYPGSPPSYKLVITAVGGCGKFGTTTSDFGVSYTIGGSWTTNKTAMNSAIPTIKFWPTSLSTLGTFSFTVALYRGSDANLIKTATVTYIGSSSGANAEVITYTTSGAKTITYDQANYRLADILVIGGGASRPYIGGGSGRGAPGGGGGGIAYYSDVIIGNTSLSVTIGAGGLEPVLAYGGTGTFSTILDTGHSLKYHDGLPGGNTSITFNGTTYTGWGAPKVLALAGSICNQYGGTSGNLNVNGSITSSKTGGTLPASSTLSQFNSLATGGGSVSGVGGNANTSTSTSGSGAQGYLSSIAGTPAYYAGGGGAGTAQDWAFANANAYEGIPGGNVLTYGTGGCGAPLAPHPGNEYTYGTGSGTQGVVIIRFHT